MIKASANPQKPLSLFQNFIEQGVECRILTYDGLHDLAVRTHNYPEDRYPLDYTRESKATDASLRQPST